MEYHFYFLISCARHFLRTILNFQKIIMNKQLKLKIITPERLVLEEMVDQVSLPTTLGEITILPDHVPLITGLTSGDVVALANGEYVPMAVVGGFVEVKP